MSEKEEVRTITSLADKHSEPLVIRKYMRPYGFPVYIALICGNDLSDLDEIHQQYAEQWENVDRGIQSLRNYFGNLTKVFVDRYEKVEGAAVVAFADKMVISSLWGDFMVHEQCRLELFSLLNMTTQV